MYGSAYSLYHLRGLHDSDSIIVIRKLSHYDVVFSHKDSVLKNKMLNEIRQLITFHISGDLLLYGAVELDYATNCKVFVAVHDYIEETGRL